MNLAQRAAANRKKNLYTAYRHLFAAREALLKAGDEEAANEVAYVKSNLDLKFAEPVYQWQVDA